MRINEVEKPWEKAQKLLLKYFIITNDDYTISNDGIIAVNTDCSLSRANIRHTHNTLPVKFSVVRGTFNISESYLTTLAGCPTETGNSFLCNHTNIKSLVGGPKIVKGSYEIVNSPIESFDGLPDEIHDAFWMTYNQWAEKLPLLKLLSIKHLKKIQFDPPDDRTEIIENILNKYVGNTSKGNILACAAELTKAGYKDNARI